MNQDIEISIERMNYGNWLKVYIPFTSISAMTATLQNNGGETLRTIKLVSGNNLIDIESITNQSLHIKIDTAYETILKELNLE